MDKRIENYLHLYLGCEGLYLAGYGVHGKKQVKAKFVGITSQRKLILVCYDKYGKEWGYDVVADYHEFVPAFRSLSDIQNSELVEIIKQVSLFHLSECEFEFGEDGERWVNALFGGKVIDSLKLVGDNVEMMNNNGSFSAINPISPVLVWFLKKGFDIFDLIPAGLAIDKTKMNTNG